MSRGNGHKRPVLDAAELREKYAKHGRMTQQAIDQARTPGSEPYREEMDSVSEVSLGKEGVKVKGAPPWLILGLGALGLAAFVAYLWLRR